jgi:hypothetical protein
VVCVLELDVEPELDVELDLLLLEPQADRTPTSATAMSTRATTAGDRLRPGVWVCIGATPPLNW